MTKAIAASALYSPMRKNLKALASIAFRQHRRFDLVPEYEREFARLEGSKHAIATSLARVGLYQALLALEMKPGERILMSAVNIPEMTAVVRLLGLEPVFVEWDTGSLFPSVDDLRKKFATVSNQFGRPRVFFSTIVAGQVGDLGGIHDACRELGLVFVQDCTQATLTTYAGKPLGRWADISLFSTCELKFIHAYRGAFVCTEDDDLASRLRQVIGGVLVPQGTAPLVRKWIADTAASVILEPQLFGRVFHHFKNSIFLQDPFDDEPAGVSIAGLSFFESDASQMTTKLPERMVFRASNFEALAGSDSLLRVRDLVDKHKAIASRYREAFSEFGILPETSGEAESSYWRFPILLASPDGAESFLRRMRRRRIVVERTGLSLLSNDVPRTREILSRTVFLPCHAGLNSLDVERVISEVDASRSPSGSPDRENRPENFS